MVILPGNLVPTPRTKKRRRAAWLWLVPIALPLLSCDAFNPAFLSLVSPTGTVPTIENPSGHVILSVVNNAEMDERLIGYLDTLLDITDAETRELRPRIRLRIRVTFTDGSFQVIEFVTGTPGIVDPSFDAESFTDVNQNDLDNAVVTCDVLSVQIEPGTTVEVFIPVELIEFELVETQTTGGGAFVTFEERQRIPPQFRDLEVDDVDEDGNTILRRNIGIRDTATPVAGLVCGSVLAVVIDGVLSVPFLDTVSNDPSYDVDDEATVAGIGGRYKFRVSVQ